ncbi:hypothetical protein [Sphingobacterium bambusae]|uniref:Lipoprotein n=1 Tax=Sphingobacterium bambusae TaxID=662858 RepID=A0ABW6BM75_9SPHI|nr:hypothetical protein [Sphingobacterium bambusae]WPL48168.1 hypothetical protein SCB77_19630 [Sphingobacterium bambusae]
MIKTLVIVGYITVTLSFIGCGGCSKKEAGWASDQMQREVDQISDTHSNNLENMVIKAFKENWGSTTVPTELEKLIEFQNNVSAPEFYVHGFAVTIDDKQGLKSWSEDPTFLEKLHPFAQANGTGSFYAIWHDGTVKPIHEMPIVVFGDEGGTHVVAENIRQLMQLITVDVEVSVEFDKVYFYKDDSYQESRDLEKYLKWLGGAYNLKQIQDPAKIITVAQAQYKQAFDSWFKQYYTID